VCVCECVADQVDAFFLQKSINRHVLITFYLRAARPVEVTTDDCCHAVETLKMGDRQQKVQEIATEVGISYGSVLNILHEHLAFREARVSWFHIC